MSGSDGEPKTTVACAGTASVRAMASPAATRAEHGCFGTITRMIYPPH